MKSICFARLAIGPYLLKLVSTTWQLAGPRAWSPLRTSGARAWQRKRGSDISSQRSCRCSSSVLQLGAAQIRL